MKEPFSLTLLSGLLSLLLSSVAPSQPTPTPTPTPAPRVEFEETTYDVGPVWEGDKAEHIFKFKNTGASTLVIKKVSTSCGCTAALVSNKNIEPGEAGEIKTEFNTRRYHGQQSKNIFVSTNDPLNSSIQLQLKTEVKTVARFSPRSIFFRDVTRGESPSQVIKLVSQDEPFKLTGVTASPVFFQARVQGEPGESGEGKNPISIEVSLSPDTPIGQHKGTLTVGTDHPRMLQLQTDLTAQVEGQVKYSPRMLLINRSDKEEKPEKKIVLSKKGGDDLVIRAVTTNLPQLEVQLTAIKPSREYEVTVRIKEGETEGKHKGFITIETDEEDQKEIKIPVTVNIVREKQKEP